MIWILDTSALFYPGLFKSLIKAHKLSGPDPPLVQPVLPALAYSERLRQIRRDGLDEAAWKRQLENAGVHVEPFTQDHAELLDPTVHEDAVWRTHARDYLIRCHVHGRRIVVTQDEGPAWDGLPVVDPAAARDLLEGLINERNGS